MSNIKAKNLPFLLLILDGWGVWNKKEGNAIALAKTPITDGLYKKYPNVLLQASGSYVGLPSRQPAPRRLRRGCCSLSPPTLVGAT